MTLTHVICSAAVAIFWSLIAGFVFHSMLCFALTFLATFNISVLWFSLACMAGRNAKEGE